MTTMISEAEMETPVLSFGAFMLLLFSAAAGAGMAILTLPLLLPSLESSLQGSAPQAFWFLSRAGAFSAYFLLWFSMAMGVLISNKMARVWPGGPVAFELHQYTTLLGLAVALFHGLILMGDHYIQFNLLTVFVPFASTEYRPIEVGLGQLALYLSALIALSFYVRKRITPKVWRTFHYTSFLAFVLALAHGLLSGTDSAAPWAAVIYWLSGGILLFLIAYRILTSTALKSMKKS